MHLLGGPLVLLVTMLSRMHLLGGPLVLLVTMIDSCASQSVPSDVTAPADQSEPCPAGPSGPPGCVFGDETYQNEDCIRDTSMVLQCKNGAWRYTAEKNCNTTPSPEGCMFGAITYPDKSFIVDSCMILQCRSGSWEYTGQIIAECGNCTVFGEPHFIPFDQHTYPIDEDGIRYSYQGVGSYIITQNGLENHSEFGVNSTFVSCGDGNVSCISSITYYESGLQVDLVLPLPDSECDGDDDPLCRIQVSVNGAEKNIGNSVNLFYATDGTVLVFKHNHIGVGDLNCVNIAGSKGLGVSLCQHMQDYAFLYILAMPNLEDQLYGLCDKYTGHIQDGYTLHDGSEVPGANQTEIDEFAESWGGDNDHNPNKRSTSGGRCINPLVLSKIVVQCNNLTADICKIISPMMCKAFQAGCVFDLCRVSNPDRYALGYDSHMLVHSHFQKSGDLVWIIKQLLKQFLGSGYFEKFLAWLAEHGLELSIKAAKEFIKWILGGGGAI